MYLGDLSLVTRLYFTMEKWAQDLRIRAWSCPPALGYALCAWPLVLCHLRRDSLCWGGSLRAELGEVEGKNLNRVVVQ